MNLPSFSPYRNYSYPFTLSNVQCRRTLLELNSQGPYPSLRTQPSLPPLRRWRRFARRLFLAKRPQWRRARRNGHVAAARKRRHRWCLHVTLLLKKLKEWHPKLRHFHVLVASFNIRVSIKPIMDHMAINKLGNHAGKKKYTNVVKSFHIRRLQKQLCFLP